MEYFRETHKKQIEAYNVHKQMFYYNKILLQENIVECMDVCFKKNTDKIEL